MLLTANYMGRIIGSIGVEIILNFNIPINIVIG